MATTAERIQKLRTEFGLSQEELAKALGFSRDTISSWERGIRNPTGERLAKLARYFYVTEDYISCKSDVRVLDDKLNRVDPITCFTSADEVLVEINNMVKNLSEDYYKMVYDFARSLQFASNEIIEAAREVGKALQEVAEKSEKNPKKS